MAISVAFLPPSKKLKTSSSRVDNDGKQMQQRVTSVEECKSEEKLMIQGFRRKNKRVKLVDDYVKVVEFHENEVPVVSRNFEFLDQRDEFADGGCGAILVQFNKLIESSNVGVEDFPGKSTVAEELGSVKFERGKEQKITASLVEGGNGFESSNELSGVSISEAAMDARMEKEIEYEIDWLNQETNTGIDLVGIEGYDHGVELATANDAVDKDKPERIMECEEFEGRSKHSEIDQKKDVGILGNEGDERKDCTADNKGSKLLTGNDINGGNRHGRFAESEEAESGEKRIMPCEETVDGEEEGKKDDDEGMISDEEEWEGIERSELEKNFAKAVNFVKYGDKEGRLGKKVGSDMMQLYGLQKVAMEGPCHELQPMVLMLSARAKWNAWQRLGNMSPEEAMEQYIALVSSNVPSWMEYYSAEDEKRNPFEAGVHDLPNTNLRAQFNPLYDIIK
ncbi:hypothetical protein Nepgr_025595 [Nepenthes gracilis]|uniref:ACB domain-containing protein n=1 Tax=Nepenthes gracilis TaxID=150966 RepID=A0AAD3T6S7_NEPGR|nr:hypothetical protein Nepgr_025595 [Nepenthes gracilis]